MLQQCWDMAPVEENWHTSGDSDITTRSDNNCWTQGQVPWCYSRQGPELEWSYHQDKCLPSLAQLRRLFPAVPRRTRILLYNALVLPHVDYCSCIWGTCGVNLQMKLERIQNYAMRLKTSTKPRTPMVHNSDLNSLGCPYRTVEKCKL